MKKLTVFLMIVAVSLGSINVFGQGAPKPIFGAKGGLNLADITGEADNKMKTAFHAGVYSEVFFDYFLMMQAEFLLSYQGHAPFDDQPTSAALNLWYINLPIMARYNLGYNFNVHAGVQFGFLLSAKSKFNDGFTESVKDQKKTLDFGLPIGVGYEFWDRKLSGSFRYIIPISNTEQSDLQTRKNSVFQISLGFKLMTLDE